MSQAKRVIYLLRQGEKLVEMHEAEYEKEDLLQRLLATYPSLLAGDQMNRQAPRRWLLVDREASVPGELDGAGRWSLDHLFLDQDAVPTLVEVKRSSDTRIRREVVGQMLDYAANAVAYWPLEHIKAHFERRCEGEGLSAEQELAAHLEPGGDPVAFWQQAKTNLQAGRIRMVFVADEIPDELRRIVEFLNVQMDPAEVLAVEIKQYKSHDMQTLVPTVIGKTEEATLRKGGEAGPKRQWDERSFFEDAAQHRSPSEVAAARRILDWCRSQSLRIWWGQGRTHASFVPVFDHAGVGHQLFYVSTSGAVEIYFYWYTYKGPFREESKRLELMHRLNKIPGFQLTKADIKRRPSVQLAILADEGHLAEFLGCFRWFIEEVRAAKAEG